MDVANEPDQSNRLTDLNNSAGFQEVDLGLTWQSSIERYKRSFKFMDPKDGNEDLKDVMREADDLLGRLWKTQPICAKMSL
jgi:hypothetical protein